MNMSKSCHTTNRDLKGKTKKEIDDMVEDPDSILNELAEKRLVKKETIKERRNSNQKNENEL